MNLANPETFQVEGHANEPVQLPIAAGPPTGHDWFLDLPDKVKRADNGPERPQDSATRLGSATGGYLSVMAAEPGEYVIIARLARPWERDKAVRTVRIELKIR